MPTVSLDTDDPGLREEIHQLLLAAEQGGLSPETVTTKVLNLLVTYAHLNRGELTADDVTYYAKSLIEWISATIKSNDPQSVGAICSLWDGESWDSIKEKLLTEASVWHVWWMDGVRKYIAIDRGWLLDSTEGMVQKTLSN